MRIRYDEASEESPLYLLEQGFKAFPLNPRSKAPATDHGFYDASSNVEQVRQWLGQNPQFNWGVRTGKESNIWVLDIDPRHDGDESLQKLEQKYGKLPETACVFTGGGGQHYYFRYDHSSIGCHSSIERGIDVKGDGGYVVAPGSIHPDTGAEYFWDLPPREHPIVIAPSWLTDLVQQKTSKARSTSKNWPQILDEKFEEGKRNERLTSLAGLLLRHRLDPNVVLRIVWSVNKTNCSPPLERKEIFQIVKSISRYQ